MCGIVGYVGPQQASTILLDGLKKLEYRGYDSAGLAVFWQGEAQVVRCAGKLDRLIAQVVAHPLPGTLGIGHTRWATHGRPTDQNAHPHKFGRVSVVHNGIVENYLTLRTALAARGDRFSSETDTEIVAHLVQGALDAGMVPFQAVRHAIAQLSGVYALCIVIDGVSDRFFCAKKDAPLILGLGEGENFVAADIPAIIAHTRRIVVLEDGDVAEIRADGVQIVGAGGAAVDRPSRTVNWTPAMAEKEGYKDFMLKEIFEQPGAIAETLRGRVVPGSSQLQLETLPGDPTTISRMLLTACGTAFHACLLGKWLIESLARIPVEVDLASEWRYRDPILGAQDVAVAVSQSGETADTRAALLEAKRRGATTWAITNVIDSSIARAADGVLYTSAGPEIGVASTKAFTTQVALLHLLALQLARARGTLQDEALAAEIAALVAIPQQMQAVLQKAPQLQAIAQRYLKAHDWLFLGRGVNYPIALEGALKLKEISYAHAEGYAAGEMKHGPIALVDENVPVVVLALAGPHYDKVMNNLEQVRSRGGQIIAIATDGDTAIARLADAVVTIPDVPARVQPFLAVLPLQLLSYYVADGRGLNVDQPRNLAKSVTVE